MAAKSRPAPRHAAPSPAMSALRIFFYLVMLGVAGVGQATGLMHLLHWPLPVAVPAVFVLELFAVVIFHEAMERRQLGERALALLILSGSVALMMLALQWLGHQGQQLAFAVMFCGASLSAFVYLAIRMENKRRDIARAASGEDPVADPKFDRYLWKTDPDLCREARMIFRSTKVPDPKSPTKFRRLRDDEALDRAREARAERERRAALLRLAREEMTPVYGAAQVEMALLTAKPGEATAFLAEAVDWRALMTVFARRLDPALLDTAMAKGERERHRERVAAARDERDPDRVTTPRATRSTPTRSRATSTRSAGTRSRGTGDAARDAWWNPARDEFYAVYADRLDQRGEEIGGEELAAGLGIADPGNARTARGKYLRTRYADDVARRARGPRDRVVLPAGVQSLVAERVARGMTGELRTIGERTT